MKRGKKRASDILANTVVLWITALMLTGLMGCTKSNNDRCESNDDCGEGERCNLDTNECEPEEWADGGVDGGEEECDESSDCESEERPICDEETGLCRGCEGADECIADYPNKPYCDEDRGACVECETSADDCGLGEGAPICNEETGTCEVCTQGPEGNEACEGAYGESYSKCGDTGECVGCRGHYDCEEDETTPICDTTEKQCRGCNESVECQAIDSSKPYCEQDSGACVECRTDGDCENFEMPICVEGECRGCESHTECDEVGGLCDKESGACLEEATIVYVDCGATEVGDGTKGSPYDSIQAGVDAIKDNGVGPNLLVEGECENVSIVGVEELNIYGKEGAKLQGGASDIVVEMSYGSQDPEGIKMILKG